MKKIVICLCSLIACIAFVGCGNVIAPSKNKITKKYSVSPFKSIDSNVAANIVFTQGNATLVEASGPDNYISQIIVSCKDSVLRISMKKLKNFKDNAIRITISSPTLTSLYHKGVGNIFLEDTVIVENLTITAKGVGNMTADAIIGNNISITSDGVGDVNVKGKVQSAEYRSSGVGNLRAKDMIATNITVEQNGVGNISCYGSEKIEITSKGIGNVDYYGNPEISKLNKSGIGSVKHK